MPPNTRRWPENLRWQACPRWRPNLRSFHLAEDELPRDADNVCHALANFMLRSIRRHLGQYAYQRQIEAATTLEMLLPHLHPLIDAIVVRAGPEAGAEFADTAAFLLQPPRRARR